MWTREQATSQVGQSLSTSMYRRLLNAFLSVRCIERSAVRILHRRPPLNYQHCHVSSDSMKSTTNMQINKKPVREKLLFILTPACARSQTRFKSQYLTLPHATPRPHRTGKVVSFTWRAVAFRWCLSGGPNLDEILIGALKGERKASFFIHSPYEWTTVHLRASEGLENKVPESRTHKPILPERAARPLFPLSVNWNPPRSSRGHGWRCVRLWHSPNPQLGSWCQLR